MAANRLSVFDTVQSNLCLGCGICSDVCPSNAINIKVSNGEYRPEINKTKCNNSKGCTLCAKVCPGLGVQLNKMSEALFAKQSNAKHNILVGWYVAAFSGYSNDFDVRLHSASGGIITSFLSFLLDNGYISAAVVVDTNFSQPFLNKTRLVHNSSELKQSRSSKYCPVSFDSIIPQVKEEKGKVVIVGLPCVLHGFRKYETFDKVFKEKILGYFGLYCSCSRSFNLTEYVFNKYKVDIQSLKYFQYRDDGCLGDLVAIDAKKTTRIPFQLYYHPLRSFFIPNRCHLCIDHYAELSDVSFGDIHYSFYKDDKVGVNSIVVRSSVFVELLTQAQNMGYLTINSLSDEELVACQHSAPVKKSIVGGYLTLSRKLGLRIPSYDVKFSNYSIVKATVIHFGIKCQMFVGKRRYLWWIIRLLGKKGKIE